MKLPLLLLLAAAAAAAAASEEPGTAPQSATLSAIPSYSHRGRDVETVCLQATAKCRTLSVVQGPPVTTGPTYAANLLVEETDRLNLACAPCSRHDQYHSSDNVWTPGGGHVATCSISFDSAFDVDSTVLGGGATALFSGTFVATCDLAESADGCGGVDCGGLTVAAQGSVYLTEAVSYWPDDVVVGNGQNNNGVLPTTADCAKGRANGRRVGGDTTPLRSQFPPLAAGQAYKTLALIASGPATVTAREGHARHAPTQGWLEMVAWTLDVEVIPVTDIGNRRVVQMGSTKIALFKPEEY